MSYRLAKSLETLRAEANRAWPNRNKASDGWIGDAKHASRSSDHNPWVKDGKVGVVTALDITHDPARGCDAGRIAETVKNDPRVKYVIWNRKIWNPSISKSWRNYTGSNPHTLHIHISVKADKANYDSAATWNLDAQAPTTPPTAAPSAPVRPLLKRGSKGEAVRGLQTLLGGLTVDGDFGPKTETAVRSFQAAKGLVSDGIVGPYTWQALTALPKTAATVVTDWPAYAKRYFQAIGFSEIEASAFTAGFIWESGGNTKTPWTIVWDAVGDAGKSHGAGQWSGSRNLALREFALKRGKPYTDPDTQLAFAAYELATTEKRADAALRVAKTIEEANAAAITYWRPSIPHADKRLAIAKALMKGD